MNRILRNRNSYFAEGYGIVINLMLHVVYCAVVLIGCVMGLYIHLSVHEPNFEKFIRWTYGKVTKKSDIQTFYEKTRFWNVRMKTLQKTYEKGYQKTYKSKSVDIRHNYERITKKLQNTVVEQTTSLAAHACVNVRMSEFMLGNSRTKLPAQCMLGRRGEFEGVTDWLPVLPLWFQTCSVFPEM